MRITIIGSGNVATHLSAALKNAGHNIVQVYSRNINNASLLAYHVGAEAIDDPEQVDPETDLFMIAVNDDAIASMVSLLLPYRKLIVHTSGSVSLQQLLSVTNNAGIFYPLQTFSKSKELNFLDVPLCIEGATETINNKLEQLARTISNRVYRVNSSQRRVLHLAAVFACNFANHMYTIAQHVLAGQDMRFDILRPLIMETAEKVKERLPADVQTGPAARNDEQTILMHLQMLKDKQGLPELYEMISQDIIKNQLLRQQG